MLIVLQGPVGSGKTTLANHIVHISHTDVVYPSRILDIRTTPKFPPNIIVMLDNIDKISAIDLDRLHEYAKSQSIIVTTTLEWPDPTDFVWHLERIATPNMLIDHHVRMQTNPFIRTHDVS